MPEGEALEAAADHGILELLSGFRILESVDRIDILEHEGQIEEAELFGELLELRQRRRRQLHVALEQRFQHLVVIVEARVRIDLHTGLAVHLGIDPLGEKRRRDTLGVLVGVGDVAELDDDFTGIAFCENRCRDQGKGGPGYGGDK
jgi:hypothetical protein